VISSYATCSGGVVKSERTLRQFSAKGELMARIAGVSVRQAGPYTKIAYFFTRRSLAKLTGKELANSIQPLEIYAHVPALLRG
jgi:hypothetical protein